MPKIRQAHDFPGDIGESGDLLYRAEAGDDMPPKVAGVDVFRRMDHKLITAQSSVPAGTYARALDELKENLGVTLTYIARCLGLQRSAVYRWYEGRLPHPANRSRLQTVREFAQAWREAKLPSLREYWDAPVPAAGATLGELLSAEVLDVTALRGAIKSLVTGTGAMPPKPPRLGFPDRQRNRHKDRERLSVLIPPTSHEDDADEEP